MQFSRDHLLRPEDVCAVLGTKPKTLANWRTQRCGPPFIKIGRWPFYSLDALTSWLEQQSSKQTKGFKSCR